MRKATSYASSTPRPIRGFRYCSGISETRIENVTLEVGQSKAVNIQLKPGEVRESVTIVDSAPLVTTDRADRGTVVENKFVQSIPLKLRHLLLLVTLTPGVTARQHE